MDKAMKWVAAACAAAAVAAGGLAFTQYQAAAAATARVAQLEADAKKAQADLAAAQKDRDAARKESADLKAEAQQLRAAADSAAQFLEMEKAISTRLREDLAMASARLAASGKSQQRSTDTLPPGVLRGLVPMPQQPPITIRMAPGSGAAASSAAAAAPAR